MLVAGISGSLRQGSYNTALLLAAAAELPAPVHFARWRDLALVPAYDEERDGPDDELPAVSELRRTLAAAEAVLIATPEYNGSVPGALKNALDWASRPYPDNCLRGKPVAVVGASTGPFGAVWAQAELRKVLRTMGAAVLESGLSVASAHAAFTPDGRLRDPMLAAALRSLVDELVERTVRRAA
ncbi:MAG TPA: NADPH-dependent FMN reductase [Gaiellaceae bacterium]|jgi:chromate reductase